MGLLPLDFESSAYTNFATSARSVNDKFLLLSRQAREKYICRESLFLR